MAEYIEREAVEKAVLRYSNGDVNKQELFLLTDLIGDITDIPAAEVQPVKRGRWIKGDMSFIYCSECHKEAYWDTDYGQQLFDYCPYCGADMREPTE